MNIVIVGVGALGSNLLFCARNVEARFTLIDFDKVEAKNIKSQFHSNMVTGRNKALALQQSMHGLFGLRLDAYPHRLQESNVATLLGPANLVVDCVDNGDTRRLIQNFVRAQDIACVHGALSADGQFGRICWDEGFVVDDEDVSGQPTCEGGEHLPFIVQVSSLLAGVLQTYVKTGKKTNLNVFPGGTVKI